VGGGGGGPPSCEAFLAIGFIMPAHVKGSSVEAILIPSLLLRALW
jgi:hypothetical protein